MVPPRKSMVIDLDSSSDESNAVQNRRPVIASSSSSSSGSSSSSSSQAARQPPTSASAPAPTLVIRHKPQASQGSRPNGASRNSNERMRNSLQSQRANFSKRPEKSRRSRIAVSDSEPEREDAGPSSISTRAPPLNNNAPAPRPAALPKLRRGKPLKRPPPLPKALQSCSSVIGLVLSADPESAQSTSSHRHASVGTPMPSASTATAGGLNRTGSVRLKTTASGIPGAPASGTGSGSQRSASPVKSEPRGSKRKRQHSPSSSAEATSREAEQKRGVEPKQGPSSEDESASDGELRWLSIAEEPILRWHRAPNEGLDSDFEDHAGFTDAFTWKPSARRGRLATASTRRRPPRSGGGVSNFADMGEYQGYVMRQAKPSLARMIVHPCLGNSAQVVLDRNPRGNGGKSEASLTMPLRPVEHETRRRPTTGQLNFDELAEAVGFDSTWLSSASSDNDDGDDEGEGGGWRMDAVDVNNGSSGNKGKQKATDKPAKARKSTAPPPPPPVHSQNAAPQASSSAVKLDDLHFPTESSSLTSQSKANSGKKAKTSAAAEVRSAGYGQQGSHPGLKRRRKAHMVVEKPQWVWNALMQQVKSGEVPRSIVPRRLLEDLGEAVPPALPPDPDGPVAGPGRLGHVSGKGKASGRNRD